VYQAPRMRLGSNNEKEEIHPDVQRDQDFALTELEEARVAIR